MEKFVTAFNTDIGTTKQTNQDAFIIKHARILGSEYLLAGICDGMGGLDKGELASADVVREFARWFDIELPKLIERGISEEDIKQQWKVLIADANRKIVSYGMKNNASVGTTATMVLFFDDNIFYCHVGDCRLYEMSEGIFQLTEDQTFIAREIARGAMTHEEAMNDPRRNMLLQCIGATGSVAPDFKKIQLKSGVSYLICSDGFRHEVSEDEIFSKLAFTNIGSDRQIMQENIKALVDTNKSRNETDNITAVLISVRG